MKNVNLSEWGLREKIGQLFTFAAFEAAMDENTRKMITDLKAGGIFLGTNCLLNPKQVYDLTSNMQETALGSSKGFPLFISADFVAGVGCKLKSGGTHFPKNRALGAGRDDQLAYASGKVTALESLAIGVNFNYSPVADINNNPQNPVIGTHSFGEDKELVSQLARSVISGYQENGMIATAKHFPGHGDTHVDSHEDLPRLDFDKTRLEQFELEPFRQVVRLGVDAIMIGHISVPSLDPTGLPASLSYPITTQLLREKIGFDGLIVTDGLSMQGITKQYTMEQACVKALQAGTDILLATADCYELAESMVEAVVQAVKAGEISMERIDESVRRILIWKKKYRLVPEAFVQNPFNPAALDTREAREINQQLGRKAVTPLPGLVPGELLRWIDHDGCMLIRDQKLDRFAASAMQESGLMQERVCKTHDQILEELKLCSDHDYVVLAVSHNKPMSLDWLQAVRQELSRFKKAVWVHFGSEYDVSQTHVPCLLMYDFSPSLQEAAAEFLLNKEAHKSQ